MVIVALLGLEGSRTPQQSILIRCVDQAVTSRKQSKTALARGICAKSMLELRRTELRTEIQSMNLTSRRIHMSTPLHLIDSCTEVVASSVCIQPPSGNCATPVTPYNYEVPFGNAWWNIPVCRLGKWVYSDEYRDRWYYWGTRNDTGASYGRIDFDVPPTLTDVNDFSMPVYKYSNSTQQRYVFISPSGYGTNFPRTQKVPWNPTWTPSYGTDHHIIILDDVNGTEWDIWALDLFLPGLNCVFDSTLLRGFDENTDLCAGSATMLKKKDGSVADYRVYEGNNAGSRGVGIQTLAMLVTAQEVLAGEIRHAVAVASFNPMFGPACNASEMDDPTKFGVSCGYAVKPAGLLEKASYAESVYPAGVQYNSFYDNKVTPENVLRQTTVPEGMRYAVNISDSEIESWISSKGYQDPISKVARVVARALREYGFVISDTGGYATGIAVDGIQEPNSRAIWQSLGMIDFRGRLLDGLIQRKDQVWTVAPPVGDDGTWYTVQNPTRSDSFTVPAECYLAPGATPSSTTTKPGSTATTKPSSSSAALVPSILGVSMVLLCILYL